MSSHESEPIMRGPCLATYRGTTWAKVKARKQQTCVRCGSFVQSKGEIYRPLAERNGVARYERLCLCCVETPHIPNDDTAQAMLDADAGEGIRYKDVDEMIWAIFDNLPLGSDLFKGQTMIDNRFYADQFGNPAGGTSTGRGFSITWQNGPLGRGKDRIEPNGAFVEDIIKVAIDRLEFYQSSKFRSNFNAAAIADLEKALASLNARTANREAAGVEGTHRV